jgi:hypothetical protein
VEGDTGSVQQGARLLEKINYREYGGKSGRRTRKIEEEARLKLKEGSNSGSQETKKVQVIEAWSNATVIHG